MVFVDFRVPPCEFAGIGRLDTKTIQNKLNIFQMYSKINTAVIRLRATLIL